MSHPLTFIVTSLACQWTQLKCIFDDQSASHCAHSQSGKQEIGNISFPWLIKILCAVWNWVPLSLIKGAGLFFIQQAAKLQWAWSHTKGLCIVLFDYSNDPDSGNNGGKYSSSAKKKKTQKNDYIEITNTYVQFVYQKTATMAMADPVRLEDLYLLKPTAIR